MELYLSLGQRRFNRFDYGMTISGTVWEDAARTMPHDLSVYDNVYFRYFRRDGQTNYINELVTIGDPSNSWSFKAGQNSFPEEDVFHANVLVEGEDLKITTYAEEILVEGNGLQ